MASLFSRVRGAGGAIALGVSAFAALIAAPQDAFAQGLIRDAEIEDSLRVYETPLLVAAGLDPNDVRVLIVSDPSINAFVAGGENIFINTGTIMAADTPNELIGVMAHETGHIAGGHLARSDEAQRQAMGPMLISIGLGVLAMAAGAPQAGAALIAGSPQFAMANLVRHTQVQESSADQAATTYLEATHQSGRGFIDFFNKNLRPYEFMVRRAPPWMITHPFSSDRVEALRLRVSTSPYYNTTDTEDNIRRLRFMKAKLVGFILSEGQTLTRYPLSDTSQPARYARAVAYYRVSDLPRAREQLESLLAESPNNPYFQELMGQILFENGRAEESIPYHRRSNELAANQPLLEINLARALTAAHGRAGAEEAINLLQAALAREPDNAYAWREIASARDLQGNQPLAELASAEQNFALGDYGAALNFAERARRELPHNTVSYQRAMDIVNFAGDQMRDRAAQQQRQGGGRS
jgi:predicted Zn-dependent protease